MLHLRLHHLSSSCFPSIVYKSLTSSSSTSSLNLDQTQKQLKIFFHAFDAIDHLNACVGVAQALASRGHKIYFLLNETFKGQLVKFGFEENLLKNPPQPSENQNELAEPVNRIKEHSHNLIYGGFLSAKSPLDKMKHQLELGVEFFKDAFTAIEFYNTQIKDAIHREKPDFFIIDSFLVQPAVQQAPCPWVFLCSAQPLSVLGSKGTLPPYCAGFAINSDPSTWEEFIPNWKKFRYERFGRKAQEEINRKFNFTPTFEINDDINKFN